MPRSFVIAATLIAGTLSIAAHAQTQGDPDANTVGGGAALPMLILPDSITRPLTSNLGAEGNGAARAPGGMETPETPPDAPYSVEGEEPLDPGGN
ncbi:MAG: hypothetical protein WB662_05045 [Methyloceanibacter sp.]